MLTKIMICFATILLTIPSLGFARRGAVDGQCGSAENMSFATAPSGSELCAAGTASSVSGSGPWTWRCSGSKGGLGESCTALLDAIDNGSCSTSATGNNTTFNPSDPAASGLHLTFDEEFNTLSIASPPGTGVTWENNFYYNAPDGCNYDALPFSIANGILDIHVSATSAALKACGFSVPYTTYPAGHLDTHGSFSQTYGYFEIRAKASNVFGTIFAFWMLPLSGAWPPEIDAPEILGNNPTTDFVTNHWVTNNNYQQAQFYPTETDLGAAFHNYGMLWTASNISWYFDGNLIGTTATRTGEKSPMYLILDFSTGSCGDGWADCPQNGNGYNATTFFADAYVDWIHVWGQASSSNPLVPAESGFSGGNGSCSPKT